MILPYALSLFVIDWLHFLLDSRTHRRLHAPLLSANRMGKWCQMIPSSAAFGHRMWFVRYSSVDQTMEMFGYWLNGAVSEKEANRRKNTHSRSKEANKIIAKQSRIAYAHFSFLIQIVLWFCPFRFFSEQLIIMIIAFVFVCLGVFFFLFFASLPFRLRLIIFSKLDCSLQ